MARKPRAYCPGAASTSSSAATPGNPSMIETGKEVQPQSDLGQDTAGGHPKWTWIWQRFPGRTPFVMRNPTPLF